MAAAASLISRQAPSSPLPLFPANPRYPKSPASQFSIVTKPLRPPFSLFCAPPPSASHPYPAIFLPFLEEEEAAAAAAELDQPDEDADEEAEEEEEKNQLDLSDPIVRFFKSRPPTKDPPVPGRFTLQSNRRTQWRLAPDFDSDDDEDPETASTVGETQPVGGTSSCSDSSPLPEGIVGEILRIARSLPVNTTLGEQLDGYQDKISEKQSEELLQLLSEEEGMVMSCLYFFEWMGLQEPSLVTPRAFTILFPLLGRAAMADRLMILFNNLPQTKPFRDVHVYNSAISGLLCCGRYDDACKVFEKMEVNNIRPDHITCSIMITIMRKRGCSSKEAWGFFQKMNRKGVKWSTEVLGALIKSFCDEGLKEEALIIQSQMEKKGVPSNAIVYNTLMDAYAKSNQVEEAEGLLAEMKAKGVKPTSASFNVLMDAYSRRMQPDIVENLLQEMQDEGLKPDAKSFTCLISAYGRQKKMSDVAADAFLRMKKFGIKPTSHSYTALIHAYSVSGWHEKAYTAFENMRSEGVKPAVETYTALLDAFRRAGDTETLMKIWKQMRSDKVQGTRVTFNIVLDGFAKQGCYLEARDVIHEFGKLGFTPTVMTYNMLMNAYARGGQHSKLPQLLKDMSALNLKPDSVTYLTMIYAYVRVRDFKRAFFYHKQMVKSGQLPADNKSYQKLRRILDVKAAIKNRKDRSAILGIINSTVGLKPKKKRKKDEFWKTKRKHPLDRNPRMD
ncbi:unnamed protein product [Linum trigynum]|uniref:Pentatricopeptide repeat-containing protein n=1 Tax=Linum trigynum TaxID=586398 RepID=A0AAV2G6R3_9ROSI